MRIRIKLVLSCLNLPPQRLPGITEENRENCSYDSQSLDLSTKTKDTRTQRYIQPRLSLRDSDFSKQMFLAGAQYITC